MSDEIAEGNGTDLFDPYARFKFQLGQRVEHKVSGDEGLVVRRVLVQAQHGNTGRMYSVCIGLGTYLDQVLEIELEAVEGDDG